jgi:hypothetical protein
MQSLKSSSSASRSVLPEFRFDRCSAAQKQLIVGRRSFHFAVNRISYLEGVGWRGFWARPNANKPVLRNAPLKKQLFWPESRLVARAATPAFRGLGFQLSG